MNGLEVFLGGMATLGVLSGAAKATVTARRAAAAADIARVGTSPVSLLGRVLVTALVIVSVQWLVITHSDNRPLLLMVLGFPALVASFTLVKALTVTQIRPARSRGDRR
ncbi:MAG: hypothetical protein LC799_28780 [Actinobacteria bacterium]|nr:hypothetical protein [Actinomycetota bacterium]